MPRWSSEDLANYELRKRSIAQRKAGARAVDTGQGAIVQPDAGKALESHIQGAKPAARSDKGRTRRRHNAKPILRITVIAFTRSQIDLDNLGPATKYIRDAIAEYFGVDDSERVADWQYSSIATRGQCGVIVTIEPIIDPDAPTIPISL